MACDEAGYFVVAMRLAYVLDDVSIVPEGDLNGEAVSNAESMLSWHATRPSGRQKSTSDHQ